MELVKASSYVHLDETSAKNKGDKHWCWVATNKSSTVFKIANSRGKKVKTYAMFYDKWLNTGVLLKYSIIKKCLLAKVFSRI